MKAESILAEHRSGKALLARWLPGVRTDVSGNKETTESVERDIETGLETLVYRSENGDQEASDALARLLPGVCSKFSKLCKTKPDAFRKIARACWRWPVMMSPHPFLQDDYELLFRELQLGADTPFELHNSARWTTNPASQIAFNLLIYLWMGRKERRDKNTNWGAFGTRLDRLPRFDSDSAEDWWAAARAVFIDSYPKPQEISELNALVKSKSKRKSPGRIKQAILDLLHNRFVSFAPPPQPCQI